MTRFNYVVVPVGAVLLAACAASREQADQSTANAETALAGTVAGASADAQAAPSHAEAPPAVVDVKDFAPSENAGLVCRDMLRPASNVILRYCGTPAEWKEFDRQQSRWSQEITRTLQGGSYR